MPEINLLVLSTFFKFIGRLVERVRIKICGITQNIDALRAVELGADALGLVFYSPSPRAVTVESAQQIAKCIAPFVTLVGLFVNASPDEVRKTLAQVPLNLLQFHGDESPQYCEQFAFPYIKALRMKPDVDVVSVMNQYTSARGILLDAYKPGVPGGTGESFDWDLVPKMGNRPLPIILAGGLTPQNISEAIDRVQPFAVDVSGGVEKSPGIKDQQKLTDFFAKSKR